MTDPRKIIDGLLVLQYRAGSNKALGVLVRKYHPKLCKHSYWYTHDLNAAKDIVQDSWSIIINKMDSLSNPNLFGSWAFRIVTRKSLDYVNRKNRELRSLQIYHNGQVLEEVEGNNDEAVRKLLNAMRSLPNDQQIVLRLFYTEDYSLKEISEILEIAIGTVKSRLFHAREKLKTILRNNKRSPLEGNHEGNN
ncbi:MAG: RNA polymerase sigma factor [Maribacter sp.]|uniref:RNA polymerase sigma factor n=1 Tax=Maribacter sp. TaxID=1897614 RepID=UPI0032983053